MDPLVVKTPQGGKKMMVMLRARRAERKMTHSNLRVRVPFLERVKSFQAKEVPELVHRAHAPLARLHHAEHLDEAQACGRAPCAIRACRLLGGVVEDARKIVVAEPAVRAFEAREGAGARVGVDGLPGVDDGGDEVGELELVERLPAVLERDVEDVLSPLDVRLRRGRVPLHDRTM